MRSMRKSGRACAILSRARRFDLWALLSICALSTGCGDRSLTVEETDVVVTFEDEDRDYAELRTFVVPDTILDLCEAAMGGAGGQDVDCNESDHSLDDVVLRELRDHMTDLGYREVDPDDETPDVVFFVGSVLRDNWHLAVAPGYCYDDIYWWYYGCWYPGYSYAYNLPTHTVLIEMAALDEDRQELSSAWTAVLSGLYRASVNKSGAERVREAMERAFDQSSYLSEGGDR